MERRGIDSTSTRAFLARHGIDLQIKAKGQHARMIERRGAILRHCLHTMKAQLQKEGITVTFDQLLAHAIFAGNALTNVGEEPRTTPDSGHNPLCCQI